MKIADLVKLLQMAPQDAFIDINDFGAVWAANNCGTYIGTLDFESIRYIPKSGDVTIGLQGIGVGAEQAQM